MNNKGVLPPGIEDDVVFGILWIRVGAFKTVKPAPIAHQVNIQFWGEPTPASLFTSQTNPLPLQYDIKCPITFFQKYLLDMKKNLKIEVEGYGNVYLDLTTYLKKNITLTTKCPFEHFKGFFQVIGKNGKKVGSIELELCANFNPQIAMRELQEDQRQSVCLAAKLEGKCECKGECKCRPNKVNAIDVIAVERPDLFKEFYEQSKEKTSPKKQIQIQPVPDNRIPNSLNNLPNKGVFDPNKYAESINTPKGGQNFPTVEKILTYSNLKLKKEEEVINRQSSRPISIKEHLAPPSEPVSNNALKQATPIPSRQEFLSQQIPKPIGNLLNQKKISQKSVKKGENDDYSAPIFPVVHVKKQTNLSDVSEVQKMDESVSVQAQKQILSRVVNLNQQLQKQRRVSPKKMLSHEIDQSQKQKFNEIGPIIKTLPAPPNFAYSNGHEKRKSSTLLLNMVVELQTNTVSFDKKSKLIISYRPYGQKQSIRVGPQLPSNLMMMFAVGEPEVAKMNKVPFIIQFWGATDGQLLGVLKLSLIKIQKGFMLNGRLNELAIKTSLQPTVIYNDIHMIQNLMEKTVGECFLTAHIGTSAQMQSYLNKPKEAYIPPPEPQKHVITKKQQEIAAEEQLTREEGTLTDFTNLLQLIDSSNNPKIAQHLFHFMNRQEVDHKYFRDLLTNLSYTGGDVFHFFSLNNSMKCQELSRCFEDYKRMKEKYLNHASNTLKSLSSGQIAQIISSIKAKTNFGLISKNDLSQILGDKKFDLIKSFLHEAVQSDDLILWIKSLGKMPLKQIKVSQSNSSQFIEEMLITQFPNCMQIVQQIITKQQNNNELSLTQIKNYFARTDKQTSSIWFWIQLAKIVHQSFGQKPSPLKTINLSLLYNWLALKTKAFQKQRQQKSLDHVLSSKEQNNHLHKDQMPIQQHQSPQKINIAIQKQAQIMKQSAPMEVKQKIHQKDKENKESNVSIQKNKEKQPDKPQQKIIEHKFIVSLQELHLQQDLSGECTVFYRFPFEEEQIASRKIQLLREKHKYRLACSGTHKFSINQAIQQYLGQSTLSVRVIVGKDNQLYGDLHSQQLITKGSEFRVIPLFSSNKEGMAGKIKIKIQYFQEVAQQLALGRETIRDVFLPKNGFLNFQMVSTVDQNRLKQQFNIKDEFYIQISLDLFGENSSLAPQFPAFHSKLYSDFSSQLSVSGTIKLSLTPQILQHLRTGSCHARMLAIYYAKEKGAYVRKDILIGSFKAPLFAVIREDGLKGDYAFKNKLGMFISLAHCSIKYEKTARLQDRGSSSVQLSRESFWLIIDFTEIINFEGDLGWVKFQIVSKGKRFTTEKSLIREIGAFTLESKCLCLQLGEEQFSMTKILAVNMITGSEKYGLDINLRPIAKSLGRQKYSVNSHYFLVIDDQSKSRKIRVGAKIYTFRGQASLGSFIEALSRNTIRNDTIGEQKEQDYQQNLQNLRKKLKLSSKAFNDALGQILDKKKNQKLSNNFFISKIHPNLDLSPILTFDQMDLQLLAEQLASQIDQRTLLDYIQQSGLKLLNLRSQFLQRYTFSKLNQLRLDQNVEYLGLNQQIDLLVFISKIRLQENSHLEQQKEAHNDKVMSNNKMVRVSIIRGYNFQYLYNGIMPNSRVCLPEIGLQTELIQRSSEPVFNEHINFQIVQSDLKKLRIEVYHQPSQDSEPILIGQGQLSLFEALNARELPFSKVNRVVLTSLMSNRMQAALDVKIQINHKQENAEKSYSEMDESIGDSRVEEAMQRIHKLNDYKKKVALFQSSDED